MAWSLQFLGNLRDRKTSIFVLAFWNFKLKVLKYQTLGHTPLWSHNWWNPYSTTYYKCCFQKSHTVHNLREIVAGQNNKNSTGTENPKILSLWFTHRHLDAAVGGLPCFNMIWYRMAGSLCGKYTSIVEFIVTRKLPVSSNEQKRRFQHNRTTHKISLWIF